MFLLSPPLRFQPHVSPIAFLQKEPYQFFAVSVLSQKMALAQHQYTNDTHVILQVRADSGWLGYPSHNKTVKRNEDMVQNVSIGVWIAWGDKSSSYLVSLVENQERG